MAIKIGYLGPEGTFTHQVALKEASKYTDYRLIDFPTMPHVLYQVEAGELDLGVVPVENSIEGTVNVTLDVLTHEVDLFIQGEMVLDITHNLVAKSKEIADVRKIIAHPQALAQCRRYLQDKFPDTLCHSANSSGEAAVIATREEGVAAITPLEAAVKYNLQVVCSNINDYQENKTRFLIVGKNRLHPQGEGGKTSLVVALPKDKPGGLYEILGEFAQTNVNLTKIESRPAKKELGDYLFFIDCAVNLYQEQYVQILRNLEAKCKFLKVLGVYPEHC